MRKYVFSTGLVGVVTSALALLRQLRGETTFSWRVALAWVSWGITAVLAVGAIIDLRRAETGALVPADSPYAGQEDKLLERRQKRLQRRRGVA